METTYTVQIPVTVTVTVPSDTGPYEVFEDAVNRLARLFADQPAFRITPAGDVAFPYSDVLEIVNPV